MSKSKRLDMALFGMIGEMGELIDYFKKVKYQGHQYYDEKVINELGDIFWYIANLIDRLGLDFDEILEKNIAKLEKRYPSGFRSVDSIERSK